MKLKVSQAVGLITDAIKAKVVPYLKGSPGTGKSQIVHQIADNYNLQLIDIRLSQCDPTDLAGFPTIVDGKADYMPMKHFPIEGDPLPRGKAGWLIFLDEASSAPTAIQAAAYKLVLDRQVGSHKLHKNCAMVLAGNLESDGAIVHPMSTALQSRLLHLELVVDAKEWDEWATTVGNIHHHITSYIKFMPGQLYTFSPTHTDDTYACPRTWQFASQLMSVMDENSPNLMPALAGVLSQGVAVQFMGFRKHFNQLPEMSDILSDPKKVRVPEEPSILFALTGSIAHNITDKNADDMVEYVSRLPVEFQVVCLREAVRRNKSIVGSTGIQKWLNNSKATLF